jgi:hypothetical protein
MAAEAYREGVGADPASSPYNTLNALSLAWLAGTLKENENAQLALQCGEQARQKFATSRDFWDAVMCGDAELTAWLMGEKNPSITAAVHLHQVYEQAVAKLPQSAREWDSVVDQWRLLVRFLKLRNAKDDKIRIEVLEQLIGERVANPAESESVVSESSQARPAQKKKAAVSKSKAKRQPRNRPRDS